MASLLILPLGFVLARSVDLSLAVLPSSPAIDRVLQPEGSAIAPDSSIPNIAAAPTQSDGIANVAEASVYASIGLFELVLLIYLVPALVILIRQANGLLELRRMRSGAYSVKSDHWHCALARLQAEMGVSRKIELRSSDKVFSPITFGALRPTVLISASGPSSEEFANLALAHELAHLKRQDWLRLQICWFAAAIFWFNPLVWILMRHSNILREQAVDDEVLGMSFDRQIYAESLVSSARHVVMSRAHAMALSSKGGLSSRVLRIMDSSANRKSLPRIGFIVLSALSLVGTAALASTELRHPTGARNGELVTTGAAVTWHRNNFSTRVHGATPEYAASLRDAGLSWNSSQELIDAWANGVTPDLVSEYDSIGLSGLTARELIAFQTNEVTAPYVAEIGNSGISSASPSDLIALRTNDIRGPDLRRLTEQIGRPPSAEEALALETSGPRTRTSILDRIRSGAP